MAKKLPKPRVAYCQCGAVLRGEDAVFWGECEKCRSPETIRSKVVGKDTGADKSDREYHGGKGTAGEW